MQVLRRNAAEIVIAVGSVFAFGAIAFALTTVPEAPSHLSEVIHARLSDTPLGNPVNAVLLDFRAFDTLLEKGVLVLSLVGLWVLTPDYRWGFGAANFDTRHDVEPALRVLLKVLVPLGAIIAFYLLFVGVDAPGGAFQGGTLLAALGILLVLARVLPPPRQDDRLLRWLVASGFMLFGAVGLATLAGGFGFLGYPAEWAKALILAIELGLTVSVAAALFLLASGLPGDASGEA